MLLIQAKIQFHKNKSSYGYNENNCTGIFPQFTITLHNTGELFMNTFHDTKYYQEVYLRVNHY